MLGKIKNIRADLSENRLNSGNFITILHKNSGKLSTASLESISPVRLYATYMHWQRQFNINFTIYYTWRKYQLKLLESCEDIELPIINTNRLKETTLENR